jgi:hypothetical protein
VSQVRSVIAEIRYDSAWFGGRHDLPSFSAHAATWSYLRQPEEDRVLERSSGVWKVIR